MSWISVSEKLPDKYCEDEIFYNHQRVIATLKNGCVCEMWWGGANENFRRLEGFSLEDLHNNPVIAWQPLPEPYKEVLE